MFTEAEIRTLAQDACIDLAEFAKCFNPNDDTPFVYTGDYMVIGSVGSRFPWNADTVYKRDFPVEPPTLWVFIDSSTPTASCGAWVRKVADGVWVQSADPIQDPYGVEGI